MFLKKKKIEIISADDHLILADHGLSSKRWTNLASALRPLVRPQSNLDAIPARVSLWNELHNCVKSLPQNSHWKRLISRKNVSSKCDGGVTIWSNATVIFQTKFLQRLIGHYDQKYFNWDLRLLQATQHQYEPGRWTNLVQGSACWPTKFSAIEALVSIIMPYCK